MIVNDTHQRPAAPRRTVELNTPPAERKFSKTLKYFVIDETTNLLQPMLAWLPFDVVSMDIFGPLPKTSLGNS
jgi:hypothetical protein